ncbi:class III cytochrome C family protein [Parasulfuritortus cantonensis]|uniref:Class III cytochrome C family protein n=1 Tax=Parasulfuritortus cantonensis TaxID=2528202 RepID=A0A4R1BEL5_9PROT|nr:cytochrome c3 family protein [Parasulfuritortus cantonensis]TCJ15561.1 class III cytochrome C family protein [Parasulfuritortus cantonensis]
MKTRTVLLVFAANLVVLALLVFIYPHLMVAPGPLIAGHGELTTDCYACHDNFFGTPSARCIGCHKVDRIGRFTSKGAPLAAAKPGKAAFHAKLARQDCLACHGDHAGVLKYRRRNGRFAHALLDDAGRRQCAGCHARPTDALHRQVAAECASCHTTQRWSPASFDHARYFRLDGDHDARCATCHTGKDYRSYTCYGCHEHTPANIRAEHAEEGIRNWDNCVKCHRGGDGTEGHGERHGGERDDD